MQFMGNDALGFDLHAVSDFIEPCEQALALVSAGAESCDAGTGRGGPGDLHSWVDDVNSACCMQSGINVCRDGSSVPWVCNADCKTAQYSTAQPSRAAARAFCGCDDALSLKLSACPQAR